MSSNTCFFMGHHDAPERIYPTLLAVVERHVAEYGVAEFIVGRYGSFDRMATRAVQAVKENYPTVKLTLLLPYHPSTYKLEQAKGFEDYDSTCYPIGLETVPRRYAIARANRATVEQCTHLIAWLRRPASNTSAIVAHARRIDVHCTLL